MKRCCRRGASEGPDEVALHQPEGLGEEKRVRRLGGDPVDDSRQNSFGINLSKAALLIARRFAMDRPPWPGSGHQSR